MNLNPFKRCPYHVDYFLTGKSLSLVSALILNHTTRNLYVLVLRSFPWSLHLWPPHHSRILLTRIWWHRFMGLSNQPTLLGCCSHCCTHHSRGCSQRFLPLPSSPEVERTFFSETASVSVEGEPLSSSHTALPSRAVSASSISPASSFPSSVVLPRKCFTLSAQVW